MLIIITPPSLPLHGALYCRYRQACCRQDKEDCALRIKMMKWRISAGIIYKQGGIWGWGWAVSSLVDVWNSVNRNNFIVLFMGITIIHPFMRTKFFSFYLGAEEPAQVTKTRWSVKTRSQKNIFFYIKLNYQKELD